MASEIVPSRPRVETGKGANRRLRRQGLIPAVVYGGPGGARPLAISPGHVRDIARSARGVNTIFELSVEGEDATEQVMIQDFQLHPLDHSVLHADLMRVEADRVAEWSVPVHLKGESPGVKRGGHLDFITRAIQIVCRPHDIPAEIPVDISELDFGDTVRAGEVSLPEAVELASATNLVILHVKAPKIQEEKETEETEAPEEAEATEEAEES